MSVKYKIEHEDSMHDDTNEAKHLDPHSDIDTNCEEIGLVHFRCGKKSNETERNDIVLNIDHSDQKRSNYQRISKIFRSPKIRFINLLHLKPPVEDEQDSSIKTISFKSNKTKENCHHGAEDKRIFNIPKSLFDFSNENIDIFSQSYKSEFDSSRFSLHLAAKEGALERVQHIIEQCKKNILTSSEEFINTRDKLNEKGFSALHLAARYNNINVVAYLLDNGALIDIPDRDDGNTPLLLAAKYKKEKSAEFLIKNGADIRIKNNFGTTALHYASRRGSKEIVSMILKIPYVKINETDSNMDTPLHLALIDGCKQVVSILINNGADVFATNYKGERPIHNAASSSLDNTRDQIVWKEVVKKLRPFQHVPSSIAEDITGLLLKRALQGASSENYKQKKIDYVNSRTNDKDTPLHIAARFGNEKTLVKLLRSGADINAYTDFGSTPLHLAAISGHERIVQILIIYDANIAAFDKDHMTPLHRACQFGRLSAVKLLVEKGAKIDATDKNNYTPVMCAIWKGHLDIILYLINKGVQINSTDINNRNALHIAIKENQLEVAKYLLGNDQFNKMNSLDKNNRAPVHYAAANGNCQALQLLINKNALTDIGENQERTPLHLASEHGHLSCVKLLTTTFPGKINSIDAGEVTSLHLAVWNDRRHVIKLLVESGANVCLRDYQDMSPLDYAARNGREKSLQILLNSLLKKDFINASDKNCYTPLHHAAIEGHVECINLLLDYGADIQLQTNDNKNCLYLAVENLQKEACIAIIKHKQWREALLNMGNSGAHVFEKIIELAPEAGEIVLDNCIKCSDLDNKDSEYSIEYNFEFLDINPINPQNSFFAPSLMVKYKRENLLNHPLVVELINQKWSRMGQWIYLFSLCFYLIFVSFLTALVIVEKMHISGTGKSIPMIITWFTLSVACAQILIKLTLAVYIGRSYIFDPSKILEFFLYTSTALFMISFIPRNKNLEAMKWQSGSISILLAWSKLMLYLENLPFLGLYFVMFTEVLSTLLKVLLVFSILLFGFAMSFFALLHNQLPFSSYIRSIVKTFVMMLGELSYDSTFYKSNSENINNNKNKDLSIIILLVFAVIMIIVVMNLLVGLAVGDIESVRKNACLRVLQRKVHYLNILDRTYPKFIQKFVYQKSYIQKPNIKSCLTIWMDKFHKKEEEGKQFSAKKELILREISSNKEAMTKQKLNIKSILSDIENQIKRTKVIAQSISQNSKFQISID